ncbi:unnamed protein product [Peronospora destructor]|uniref:Myosin motor domain-containing protein n=1 Tax=Peronospora destructor TaxID=86335 RepID=A0AAV0UJ65_9STRA|nr:unnamed protein product [Peronospora destructor]
MRPVNGERTKRSDGSTMQKEECMTPSIAVGARCYIPDKDAAWLPVSVEEVNEQNGLVTVRIQRPRHDQVNEGSVDHDDTDRTGETRVVAVDVGFPLQNAQLSRCEEGLDNMIDLNHLHEASILRNLKKRFRARRPYTYTGDICLAVNPYQWLDEQYKPGLHKKYLQARNRQELPPHVYALLHGTTPDEKDALGLGDECSSFSYLRERGPQLESRPGQKQLSIRSTPSPKPSAVIEAENSKDRALFAKTRQALTLLGLGSEQQNDLFQVLSGILHLGEAQFAANPDNDEACALDKDSVIYSSTLLGLNPDTMAAALTHRTMKAAGEVYLVPLTVEKAQSGRDALAKAIYASIFDWLVAGINASLGAAARLAANTIGVLDIFGFESFEHNSFEQLCINYANEKLQQKFTQDVFRAVQEEYKREQITWAHISYADNSDLLALIEGRMGVLALLNEEIVRPRGNEEGFVSKLSGAYLKQTKLIEFPRISKSQFAIHHYAGIVEYDAKGFLEKHKDALLSDLSDLMCGSHDQFPQMLFKVKAEMEAAAAAAAGRLKLASSGGRKLGGSRVGVGADQTVGMQFKQSLNSLMGTINETNVNYIRCIKPNSVKSSTLLEDKMVANQLRCAGVIEAICIARAGYPNRLLHAEFAEQFDVFLNEKEQQQVKEEAEQYGASFCRILAKQFKLETPEEYQMGMTKIYLQKGVLEKLEHAKAQKLFAYVALIQSHWRGLHARYEYYKMRVALVEIQRCVKAFLNRCWFLRARLAIATIQRVWRGHQGRHIFFAVLCQTRAVRLQCFTRQYLARQELGRRRTAYLAKLESEKRERMKREMELAKQRKLQEELVRLEEERRVEDERKLQVLCEESTLTIQKNVRGYFTRCLFAQMLQEAEEEVRRREEEEERERIRLQREHDKREAQRLAAEEAAREKGRLAEERKRKAIAMRQRREKAVVAMQRMVRGHLARVQFGKTKQAAEEEEEARRVKEEARKMEEEARKKAEAATSMQSIQRGRLARQQFSTFEISKAEQEKEASRAVQDEKAARIRKEHDEEIARVREENVKLKRQLAELQRTNQELEAVVAEYRCDRDVIKASNRLKEVDLTQKLSVHRKELETVRGEYSELCNFLEKSGRSSRSTEPEELHSSDSSSTSGDEEVEKWKEDRPTIDSTTMSYFDSDRPSTDIAKLLGSSMSRATRLTSAMQQRRQKASQAVQQRKQQASSVLQHRKEMAAQRKEQVNQRKEQMGQRKEQVVQNGATTVTKAKKWVNLSRSKTAKKDKEPTTPIDPVE